MVAEMNIDDPCPKCGNRDNHWLSTTNEWEYYCPKCDIRFNVKGQIMNQEWVKGNKE